MSTTTADAPTPIRLTAFTHGGGCACKLGLIELGELLRQLPIGGDPRILVDAATRDDAAVWQLSPERALVATVDFFTPIVDDARTWGRIAAVNALSDLFAMGATPLFGLSLVGWPREKLPLDLLGDVLGGLTTEALAAGCPVLGGHSVDALEPHVGLVAIGEAHPDRLLTNARARVGDVLVLTKPIGTGVLSTALKRGLLDEAGMADAIRSMTTLNVGAMRAALAHEVRAATDVTGFGILGHLGNILRASGVSARIAMDAIPLLPRVRAFAEDGVAPGGSRRTLSTATGLSWDADITDVDRLLVADAQTSGGLLLCCPPAALPGLLASLSAEQTLAQSVIGVITDGAAGTLHLSRRG
jgi:selenide,water dikinase